MATIVNIFHPQSGTGWQATLSGILLNEIKGLVEMVVNSNNDGHLRLVIEGQDTYFPSALLKQCVITVYESEPQKR